MAKVSIRTPKGKEFSIEASRRPKTAADLVGMQIKHKTKRVKTAARSKTFRTSAKATAAGSVGNTAVNDAYELMRGGVNEDKDNGDNDGKTPTPKPKPGPTPDPWDGNSGRI